MKGKEGDAKQGACSSEVIFQRRKQKAVFLMDISPFSRIFFL
jgi:hypothetical protein